MSSKDRSSRERLPLDERVLADLDTLMVFSLDHLITEQKASPEEIQALRDFLTHEGTCLVLGPHHDVGGSDDLKVWALAFPSRIATVCARLGCQEPTSFFRSRSNKDLDKRGWLNGVQTFNFRVPHYAVTTDDPEDHSSAGAAACRHVQTASVHRGGKPGVQHVSVDTGLGERAGDIPLEDSTIFTPLFGGDESLETFWKNLATR